MIAKNKEPGKKRIWLKVLALLVLAGIVFEGTLMLAVYFAGEQKRPLVPSDAVIVLGARVMPDGELSTTLQHRIDKGLEVFRESGAPYLIVCGAQGADEPLTEADAMAQYLISEGVPESAILRDPTSFDTRQNLLNAKALMAENGLSTAIVVTSEYHLQRALWLARDVGLSATGQPCLGPNLRRNRIKANFRETLSWLNYFSGGLLARVSGLSEASGE